MNRHSCLQNCCHFFTIPYLKSSTTMVSNIPRIKKAGFFIYNKKDKMVLLIQSKGHLWGAPKGSCEPSESLFECALRELYEETGLVLSIQKYYYYIKIYDNSYYYLLELNNYDNISIQRHIDDNDVSGIGWFKIECIKKLYENAHIHINAHCRILLNKIFHLNLLKMN